MKKLFLIRHSKSSWKHPELSDHDRPLNKRGKHDAELMSETLKARGIKPDIIVTSSAVRALEFAKVISDILNCKKPVISEKLYLASESGLLGIVKETDERFPPGLMPEEVAIYIARNKAIAVQQSLSTQKTIVAADTIVVLGDNIIGKPVHREDAVSILLALSGEKHRVITGVVIRKGNEEVSFADTTDVEFHNLSVSEIEFYVEKYKPYDKAGAYAIQEWIGVVGIKSINGDFYNVMGLPVSRVVRELKKMERD